MESVNQYSVWLEVVKTSGIILTALIALWTLKISRATHTVTNGRLTETINKVNELTRELAISKTKEK